MLDWTRLFTARGSKGNPAKREGFDIGQASDFEKLYRRNLDLIRQVDELSTLREIGLAISGSLEMREVLPLIANVVQGALDIRRLTVYELDDKADMLCPVIARYGSDLISRERLEEDAVPRAKSRLGQALDARQVVLEGSVPGNRAIVPLVAKSEPLGVMVLEDRYDDQPFNTADAEFFHQVAGHIAIALQNSRLYALAVNDGLTGLFVRRYFDLQLEKAFAEARRYGRIFGLLLFDIDHFKKFNDTYGHQTGDRVLQQFAKFLRQSTRETDICCRYGGEEMAILLPETGLDEAVMLARKLCDQIRETVFDGSQHEALRVTTSIGVATYTKAHRSPEGMLRACDEALYRAKENGRDRVEATCG